MNASLKPRVTVNQDQRLYVLHYGHGVSCLGFLNAEKLCIQIALLLRRNDLMPSAGTTGTPAGYELYQEAISAWAASPQSRHTFFEIGTRQEVADVLKKYMQKNNEMLRIMVGDPETGVDSCSEFEVVGFIGRSGGSMKVPLIIEPGEDGGGPIQTSRVLRILRARDGKELYRHPKYQVPNITVTPHISQEKDGSYTWAGFHDGELVARFKKGSEATEWAEFLMGTLPCKREHLQALLRHAA
jgi:hypothetical protein